jgi:hypothetical protein
MDKARADLKEEKNKKKKNELFWLIILSTTLSDFGDNFGIEVCIFFFHFNNYNTKIFWMEKKQYIWALCLKKQWWFFLVLLLLLHVHYVVK